MTDLLKLPIDDMVEFFRRYHKEELLEFAQGYPKDNTTFVIDWSELFKYDNDLADVTLSEPERYIVGWEHALREVDLPIPTELTNARVGFRNVTPDLSVNEIRQGHMGEYIGVYGRVSEITQVNPEVQNPIAICKDCGAEVEMLDMGDEVQLPRDCPTCDEFVEYELSDKKTEARDKQLIELNTLAEESAGSETDSLMVEVYDDLVGNVSAGDTLRMNGILRYDANDMVGGDSLDRMPDIVLDCLGIDSENQTFDEFEAERIDEIKEIAERDDLFQALVDS